MRYRRVSLSDALTLRKREAIFLYEVEKLMLGTIPADNVSPLDYTKTPESTTSGSWGSAVIHHIPESDTRPQVNYRQVRVPNFFDKHTG
jgi:hypothetical protein